ncbi:MAG: hypothetical protein QOD02_790, partial [Mycobacterium sp.]|nr:hypothetical protein [Mycobacterium sp.]
MLGWCARTSVANDGSETQFREEESAMSEEAFIYEAIRTPRG